MDRTFRLLASIRSRLTHSVHLLPLGRSTPHEQIALDHKGGKGSLTWICSQPASLRCGLRVLGPAPGAVALFLGEQLRCRQSELFQRRSRNRKSETGGDEPHGRASGIAIIKESPHQVTNAFPFRCIHRLRSIKRSHSPSLHHIPGPDLPSDDLSRSVPIQEQLSLSIVPDQAQPLSNPSLNRLILSSLRRSKNN